MSRWFTTTLDKRSAKPNAGCRPPGRVAPIGGGWPVADIADRLPVRLARYWKRNPCPLRPASVGGESGVARTRARPWYRKPIVRSLTAAATGGVILLAVDAAFNVKNLQGPGLLPYLASAFVGCVVGWIYDLGTRMSEITRESIEKMTELSQILEFQQQPLRL